MASAWFRRKVRQLCDGDPRPLTMYFETVELGDVEAKLEQFAVDPWGTPQRVFLAHLLDKIAQLWLNFGPSRLTARLPAPIGSKP